MGFKVKTTTEFFASLVLHHRPNLCSWPTAATSFNPSGEKAREFIKPLTATEFISFKERKLLQHFHSRMYPS